MVTVTVRNAIPGYERKAIVEKPANPTDTWFSFFQNLGITLDENQFLIKCTRAVGKLNEPINNCLLKYSRRNKINVDVVLATSNGPRRGARRKANKSSEAGSAKTKRQRLTSPNKAGNGVNNPLLNLLGQFSQSSYNSMAAQPPSPRPRNHRSQDPFRYEEDDIEVREVERPSASIQPAGLPASFSLNLHNDPRTSNDDNPDFMDDLSQMSDDGIDEALNPDSEIIRENIIRFVSRLPGSQLTQIRKELVELKASGSSRVYKWNHYASKTCAFVLALFKLS